MDLFLLILLVLSLLPKETATLFVASIKLPSMKINIIFHNSPSRSTLKDGRTAIKVNKVLQGRLMIIKKIVKL